MSYVVESASSRRARRRRRTAITLLVVVAMLAGAFYVASSYWNRETRPAAASGCPTSTATSTATGKATPGAKASAPAVKRPSPRQVTVNVYNATSRSGLASETARTVKARGFVVGAVANDPLRKTLTGVGELRYGKGGAAAAAVAKAMLPRARSVIDDRADASVDLVLGNAYTALAPAVPGAAPTTPDC